MLTYRFAVQPLGGHQLDISELLSKLNNIPTVVHVPGIKMFKNKTSKDLYAVCLNHQFADNLRQSIVNYNKDTIPDDFFGFVALVEVTPKYIEVYQLVIKEVLQQLAEILLPVLKSQFFYAFTIENGEVKDISPKVRNTPELLFEP